MRAVIALACAAGIGFGLAYVERSTGLVPPALDGGRTELELADVDDDGNIDILSIGDHGNPYINTQEHGVMVWFGDGAGGWSCYQSGEFGYGGIAVGDVNGDGHWDVGYGMHHNYSSTDFGDQLIEVALGDGTGRNWTPWDDSLAREGQNWGMFSTDFADIDNDGDLDIGSTSFGSGDGMHIYLNLGNGAWRRSFGFLGGNSAMEFYFRDVNRDGNADIIVARESVSVWFGDGRGGFDTASAGLPVSHYGLGGLSPGDVDNDGGCDVAFTNSSGGLEVWVWNDSLARWQSFSTGLPGSGSYDGTQLCDMDADGNVDLVGLGGGHTRVFLGDGLGNWTLGADITTPASGDYSALRTGADVDHNGRPDIAMVTREGNWPNDYNRAHVFCEATPAANLGIFPVFPRGRERFAGGSVQFIDWWSEAPGAESTRVRLELSTAGAGGPWDPVADSLRNAGRYQWVVPTGVTSADCHIRYTVFGPGGSASGVTPRPFAVGDTFTAVAEPRGGARAGLGARILAPAGRGAVVVRFDSPLGRAASISVYDAAGRRLLCRPVAAGATTVRLPAVAAGVGFVRLGDGAAEWTGRFVRID